MRLKAILLVSGTWLFSILTLCISMSALEEQPEILRDFPGITSIHAPVIANQFESELRLKSWLANNAVSEVPRIIKAGDLTITWDCDDYALKLQEDALEEGYLLNVQIFKAGTKLPMSTRTVRKAHAMNTAFIGNEVWLIEPSTDECWLAWYVEGSNKP